MFALTPAAPFTDFISVIPASWLNFVRVALPDTLDAVAGGVYNLMPGHTVDFPPGGGNWVIDAPLSFSDASIPVGGHLIANGFITCNGAFTTNGVASLQGTRNLLAAPTYVNNGATLKVGDATYGVGHLVVDGAGGGDMRLQAGADFVVTGSGTSIQFQSAAVLSMASGTTANLSSTVNASGPVNLAGLVRYTGTEPAATADPGGDNAIFGANVAKAWASITTNGAGGVSIDGGYGVASATIVGGNLQLTFARAMANANFAVLVQVVDAGNVIHVQPVGRTTTTVTVGLVQIFTPPNAAMPTAANIVSVPDLATNGQAVTFVVTVFARQ
jgi:hypothetical protein